MDRTFIFNVVICIQALKVYHKKDYFFPGLRAIHDLGVIFRDLNLKNVLLSNQGDLMISDFGLAKWLNKRQRTNTVCGTLPFMAPEVAKGQAYQHKIDFWSLGILLYCLSFANYPFKRGKDHLEMSEILSENTCQNLCVIHADKRLETVLRNLLQYEACDRKFNLEYDSNVFQKTFYDNLKEVMTEK